MDFLWSMIQNRTTDTLYRKVAVSYLMTLMARAEYMDLSITFSAVDLMSKWIQKYPQTLANAVEANLKKHETFYAVCQALFYVYAHRHRELHALHEGLLY